MDSSVLYQITSAMNISILLLSIITLLLLIYFQRERKK